MEKVGIITVYQNTNYGSILQSFALQRKLKDLGYHGENLKYHLRTPPTKRNKLRNIVRNPSLLARLFYRARYHSREDMFAEFLRTAINVSSYTVEHILEGNEEAIQTYHKYICGSDQIWAPNQFNEIFFLSFVPKTDRRIAYAPSIGLPEIPRELIGQYCKLVNAIDHISVRENKGAELIKEITGRDVEVVVDPTLLLTKDEWSEHAKSKRLDDPYILCYFLGSNVEHRSWVERLSNKTGYKIVVLPFATKDFYWGDERLFEVGPREYLSLIENAKAVCTDSYHGMLFSINFNKEFYAFLRFEENDELNQNSRVFNLLDRLDLSDRIVDPNSDDEYGRIAWELVNSTVKDERNRSVEYLKRSLMG